MAKGKITAADLGLDVESGQEQEVFKWFLACLLVGKRIQQQIARQTWEVFMRRGYDTPRKLQNCSWQELVDMLGEGGYARYDESMATNLQAATQKLIDDYGGELTSMYAHSRDKQDFQGRFQELKGVGPKTAEIFMREMEPVWF